MCRDRDLRRIRHYHSRGSKLEMHRVSAEPSMLAGIISLAVQGVGSNGWIGSGQIKRRHQPVFERCVPDPSSRAASKERFKAGQFDISENILPEVPQRGETGDEQVANHLERALRGV